MRAWSSSRCSDPGGGLNPVGSRRILSAVANLMRTKGFGDENQSEVGAEASLGAVWALMEREVENGQTKALPQLVPILIWVTLAPVIGGTETARILLEGEHAANVANVSPAP